MTHRYSGWPGAWCLDCGAPDPSEEAVAHGCDNAYCTVCLVDYPQGLNGNDGHPHNVVWTDCGQHGSRICPEPGSRRHDPYYVGPETP